LIHQGDESGLLIFGKRWKRNYEPAAGPQLGSAKREERFPIRRCLTRELSAYSTGTAKSEEMVGDSAWDPAQPYRSVGTPGYIYMTGRKYALIE
jgi:hypothetical protein